MLKKTIYTWSSISWFPYVRFFQIKYLWNWCLSISRFFEAFFLHLKFQLSQNSREKRYIELIFDNTTELNNFFKNPGPSFITTFLLFETNPSPSFFCLWSSSYRTSRRIFWIKYGMNFSKLLFGMINNKGTPLFSLLFFPHLILTVNNRNWK